MRRLSTTVRPRIANRCVVTVITVIAIAAIAAWSHGWPHALWPVALCLGVACTGMFAAAGFTPLAPRGTLDAAWLDGEDVLLRHHRTTVRLPLADLATIDYDRSMNLVALVPRVPCILGDPLRFRTRRGQARMTCQELRARLREVAATRT